MRVSGYQTNKKTAEAEKEGVIHPGRTNKYSLNTNPFPSCPTPVRRYLIPCAYLAPPNSPPPWTSFVRGWLASTSSSKCLLHLNSAQGSALARISLNESRSAASHAFVASADEPTSPAPSVGLDWTSFREDRGEEEEEEEHEEVCSSTSCIHSTESAAAARPSCFRTGNSRAWNPTHARPTQNRHKSDTNTTQKNGGRGNGRPERGERGAVP